MQNSCRGPSQHARRDPTSDVSVTPHFSPALPSGVDRESQFVAISMRRSRRERLAAALGSFGARAGGWVSGRRFESVVRYIAHTTLGSCLLFGGQRNSLRGVFKFTKNRRSYATSVHLSCPFSRSKSQPSQIVVRDSRVNSGRRQQAPKRRIQLGSQEML